MFESVILPLAKFVLFLPSAEGPNPDETGEYLEGDLILTPDQLWNPQNGILNSFYRWPNNIVYYSIRSTFGEEIQFKLTIGRWK